MPSLQPHTRTLDSKTAEHLLRRTMFGATRKDITALTGKTALQAIDILLANQPTPEPPVDPTTGAQWVNATTRAANEGVLNNALRAWWIGRMVTSPISIVEKMTLFWQNHFVSTYTTVGDSRYMYKQNALLRRNALGNIIGFVQEITIDPAMLRYLNGNTNRVGAPQENYGRELQELFTIGKGPEIAPFNYTNYTEDDVRTAAKVLTGWRDKNDTVTGYFTESLHDKTDKKFSSAYGNYIVKGRTGANAGMDELNDMLDMIFKQPETARFFVRKFYRFFVNADITPEVERDIIEPVAQTLRVNNFAVKPALRQLLASEHFFDANNRGCVIKTPLDLVVGAARQFEMTVPDPKTQTAAYYAVMDRLRGIAAQYQQDVHEQPNVAGWPAYYQEPAFYQIWINTATMPIRTSFADTVINGITVNANGTNVRALTFDSVNYVAQFPNVDDPYKLMENICENFCAVELTTSQRELLLKDVLMPNLPIYEWTDIWKDWVATQTPSKRTAIKNRLDNLIRYMMGMAEYQLC